MVSPVVALSTLLFVAFACFHSATSESEFINRIVKRQWDSPELDKLVTYWAVFAYRRGEAATRCLMRLTTYANRRKFAQDANVNIVRRANPTDVITDQGNADRSELALQECLEEIISMHGADQFYQDYQKLFADVEKEQDRIEACKAAERGKLPKYMEERKRRSVDSSLEIQEFKRVSGMSHMERVFDDLKKMHASALKEKNACFGRLAIPENFPYQLE